MTPTPDPRLEEIRQRLERLHVPATWEQDVAYLLTEVEKHQDELDAIKAENPHGGICCDCGTRKKHLLCRDCRRPMDLMDIWGSEPMEKMQRIRQAAQAFIGDHTSKEDWKADKAALRAALAALTPTPEEEK